MKQYSANRRLKVIALLGGKCSKCGSVEELEVHHVDPTTKSFTLARGWHHAWVKIEEEMKKCTLLCDPCHGGHHKVDHEHGTVHKYWQGCRCDPCKQAMSIKNKQYREECKRKGL